MGRVTDRLAWPSFALGSAVLVSACAAQQAHVGSAESAADPQKVEEAPAISLVVVNAFHDDKDPRWPTLPKILELVELPPASTIRAEVPSATRSVRFTWNEKVVVDDSAPFQLDEDSEGASVAHEWTVGAHRLEVEAFSESGALGEVLAQDSRFLEVSSSGLGGAAEKGTHEAKLFWVTDGGRYVTRNSDGDFLDLEGSVVLQADQVELKVKPEDQGHLVTTIDGAPRLEFAFQLLLPDSYSPTVSYPLVVFLHHGWEVYRGTDNDGRPLETPLFSGPHSLTQSAARLKFPAVILVPQHTETREVKGVHEEWASFTDISKETGSFAAASMESRSARFTWGILDDLLSGELAVNGQALSIESRRIYLTGHSMGGLGVWDWIARRPDYFAAAVPMAGYADHASAGQLTTLPIWAFHHELDCYNPIVGTETMVSLIKEQSEGAAPIRFSRLNLDTDGKCDQAHFRTPEAAWNDEPNLLLWMFSQVR